MGMEDRWCGVVCMWVVGCVGMGVVGVGDGGGFVGGGLDVDDWYVEGGLFVIVCCDCCG